jgi:Domain of unknown function (DUF4505)
MISMIHICHLTSARTFYYDKLKKYNRFTSIIKPASFYARHGDVRNRKPPEIIATTTMTPAQKIITSEEHKQQRCYFYNIDLHGRLYLEENPIKNVTSSIKDMKFLDFFFASIKYVNETHKEYMNQHNIPTQDYPFVSICQNEWNFIRPAATPIVFHSLIDKEQYLLYGSNNTLMLREPFDETNGIVISKVSGMLYHKLTTHSYYPLSIRKRYPSLQTQQPQYALIRSTIALALSDRIVNLDDYYTNGFNNNIDNNTNSKTSSTNVKEPISDEEKNDPNQQNQQAVEIATSSSSPRNTQSLLHRPLLQHPPSKSSSSGLGFITKYNRVVPIMYLPSYAEPGPYAMSSFE